MKKTLIRAISFFLTLSLLTGLLIPFASAIEYEGVESMTVDATAALLIDLDTDQVLYEQAADEQRYPASITKILTALIVIESCDLDEIVTFSPVSYTHLSHTPGATHGPFAAGGLTARNTGNRLSSR